MRLNRILEAADEADRDNNHNAVVMLCCFAKLIQECRNTSEGNVAIDNMLSFFFEKGWNEFHLQDIREIQKEITGE